MVRDPETVYRHMFQHSIGKSEAGLYIDWSLHLEKYKRDFEATFQVLSEGLKHVSSQDQETVLMRNLLELNKRMQIRIRRDLKDPLAVDEELTIDKLQSVIDLESPNTLSKRKKRTYVEAFGEEQARKTPPSHGSKKRLLESKELRDCESVIDTYNSGLIQIRSTM